VHVSAKADYAVRAAVHLASVSAGPTTAEAVAAAQGISPKFLEAILGSLRAGGLVRSQRGAHGGYWLSRPADAITVADVLRAVEGPMFSVRGQRPEDVTYEGVAGPLREVWIAARASLREVLEHVTLADLATGRLPKPVTSRTGRDDAWRSVVSGPRR
jgi:Rrf2 family protein